MTFFLEELKSERLFCHFVLLHCRANHCPGPASVFTLGNIPAWPMPDENNHPPHDLSG